jgi:hypothetical protein
LFTISYNHIINHLRLQHLRQGLAPIHPRPVESPNWWDRLSTVGPNSLSLNWPITKRCPKFGTRLLNTEQNASSCCFDGQFPTLQLRLYAPNIDALLCEGRASDISRKLNNLFCFSTIGVHGSFQNLPSPSNVVLCGRSYHRMLDIERGQHPLRWFLYASEDRH